MGSRDVLSHFHNRGSRRKEVASFTLRPFYPLGGISIVVQ